MINSFWQLYITANSQWLIVIIFRLVGVGQPREGELEGGGVALHQLRRDVEVRIVAALTRAQRPRRHVEKVKAREPECVRGRGRDGCTYLLEGYRGSLTAVMTNTLTRNMGALTVNYNTTVLTDTRIMSGTYKYRVRASCLIGRLLGN